MISDNQVASEKIIINAPVEKVWHALIDFEHYDQWNSFCPKIEAVLEVGAPVTMLIRLGNELKEWVEYINRIEPNRTLAWGMKNRPSDPVHAIRTQSLKAISNNRCSYISIDTFSGVGAKKMLALYGKSLEEGFNACASGLKVHVENNNN